MNIFTERKPRKESGCCPFNDRDEKLFYQHSRNVRPLCFKTHVIGRHNLYCLPDRCVRVLLPTFRGVLVTNFPMKITSGQGASWKMGDARIRNVHHQFMTVGDSTQRTAKSQKLHHRVSSLESQKQRLFIFQRVLHKQRHDVKGPWYLTFCDVTADNKKKACSRK